MRVRAPCGAQAWCNALSCASSRSMHLINHMHLRAHIIAGAFSAACYLTLSAARYLSPRHTYTGYRMDRAGPTRRICYVPARSLVLHMTAL